MATNPTLKELQAIDKESGGLLRMTIIRIEHGWALLCRARAGDRDAIIIVDALDEALRSPRQLCFLCSERQPENPLAFCMIQAHRDDAASALMCGLCDHHASLSDDEIHKQVGVALGAGKVINSLTIGEVGRA